MKIIAGVDEVGRGSLIGPVYAAAVILNKSIDKNILKDSKTLTKNKRENLSKYIKKNSIWAAGKASVKEIEKISENKTIIMMSHKMYTLNFCDKIFCIEDGIPSLRTSHLEIIFGQQLHVSFLETLRPFTSKTAEKLSPITTKSVSPSTFAFA